MNNKKEGKKLNNKFTFREKIFATFSLFCLIVTASTFIIVSNNIGKAGTTSTKTILKTNDQSKDDSKETTSSETTSNLDTTWDEVSKTYETPEGKIILDDISVISGYDEKPLLKVSFTITNYSNEEQNVQSLFNRLIDVKQRNSNTSNSLNYGSTKDSEETHLSDNLNPNGTVSGFYPLELENTDDPIIFEMQSDYEKVHEWEYKLP